MRSSQASNECLQLEDLQCSWAMVLLTNSLPRAGMEGKPTHRQQRGCRLAVSLSARRGRCYDSDRWSVNAVSAVCHIHSASPSAATAISTPTPAWNR